MAATTTVLAEKQSPAALSNAYHWAISAIPGSPEFVSIRKLQLWVSGVETLYYRLNPLNIGETRGAQEPLGQIC
ncbi:hypothetical protein V499_05962 [Pseudogymnoascus sp. VKM F-103]|nr:hypothetical protein V499_05962 [Pseudogymnoascus sp. VKM F-103]